MRAKIGDVVIDKTYNKKGNLAIVVGEGISQPILIDHKGGATMDKLRDYFSIWDGLEVIGHIDFEKVWEKAVHTADRKTEPQSVTYNPTSVNNIWEKPTNPYVPNEQTEPTISKMEQVEDETRLTAKCLNCANGGSYKCSKCDGEMYYKYDKTEPQTSCKTCRFGEVDEGYVRCAYYSKATEQDEPQTERKSCETCRWESEEWEDEHCASCVAHSSYDCAWKKGE